MRAASSLERVTGQVGEHPRTGSRALRTPATVAAGLLGASLAITACGGQEVIAPELNTTTAPVELNIVAPPTTVEAPPVTEVDTDPLTLYVDGVVGDDANDGQTVGTALRSLQTALDRLQPGNTLFLLDGTYAEVEEVGNAHYVLDASGTAEAWITITGAPGARPVIVASDGNGISIRGDYVDVSGLEIRGQGFSAENPYGWGILIRNSHHVRLANNQIYGMAVGGISSVESANLEITGNEVFDNSFWGTEQGSGISIWHSVDAGFGPGTDGYHDRVIGNTVYRNENKVFSRWRDNDIMTDGNGIIVDQSQETGYTGRTLIANNVVFDNGGRAILVLESSRVDVVFNTTFHNGRTNGLEGGPVELAASRADDVRLLNNLAWSRPGAPAVTVSDATNVVMGGNLLVTENHSGMSTDLDVVTSQDPGLVAPGIDPALVDFRPTSDSLVIGRAIPVVPPLPFDADGLPRELLDPAAGAYEPASS